VNDIDIDDEVVATFGTIPAQRGSATPGHKDEEFRNLLAVGFVAAGDRLVHPFDSETVVVRADGPSSTPTAPGWPRPRRR